MTLNSSDNHGSVHVFSFYNSQKNILLFCVNIVKYFESVINQGTLYRFISWILKTQEEMKTSCFFCFEQKINIGCGMMDGNGNARQPHLLVILKAHSVMSCVLSLINNLLTL